MKIEDLIEKLEIEFDEVPKGSINPTSEFEAIENWGSMHALIIIALVDTEYEVTITGADLKTMRTVQDLFNIVQERIEE